MAVLPEGDRAGTWADIMAELSAERVELGALTKTELRAAIDAVDAWVDANTTSFNSAIPQPARGILSANLKARLLMMVVRRRWLAGV